MTKAAQVNVECVGVVPPAAPLKMARVSSVNSGRLIQNITLKARCSQSYPQMARTAANTDNPMAIAWRLKPQRAAAPSDTSTVETTL